MLARHWRETDVLFCPSYTVPLHYRGKLVVATHSVNEAEPGTHPWWYHLTYRQRNKLCARRSDAVIVPSQTTKKHVEDPLRRRTREDHDRARRSAPRSFAPVEDEGLLAETRLRYLGEDVPYVLFVGKHSQRRNIPALDRGVRRVKQSEGIPHKLLLFGPNVLEIHSTSSSTIRVSPAASSRPTDGSSGTRRSCPSTAAQTCSSTPPLPRGFSLTIVEAMACGVPVITVGRGAVAEIVADAAVTVDAPTPDLLEVAIRRVLTDPALRAEMGTKSIERRRAVSGSTAPPVARST